MVHKILVKNDNGSATIWCYINKIDIKTEDIVEIKYHQVVSTFDDSQLLSKIGNRQFTEAEELKLLATMNQVVKVSHMEYLQWIRNTLSYIYGSTCKITIQNV
jgi:hypothetical protein